MRFFLAFLFLLAVSILLGIQSVQLFRQQRELRREFADVSAQIERLANENSELRARIEYLSHPENLEKELRAFNYKKPGERLMILVPDELP